MISIIVTCFNESEIINEFIIALNRELSKINEKFEIIFIDNKSSDNTLEIIKKNIDLFKNYKIISLSNYFGKESGILAGLDNSEGEAIIIMDPDLEDPPELIKDLIMKWKEGYDVVYATRNKVVIPFHKNILKTPANSNMILTSANSGNINNNSSTSSNGSLIQFGNLQQQNNNNNINMNMNTSNTSSSSFSGNTNIIRQGQGHLQGRSS